MASLLDGHVTFMGCRVTVLLLQYAHTIVLVMFSQQIYCLMFTGVILVLDNLIK
jgi:hypothetical protein